MRKDDLIRLRHMLDAAREAVDFAQDSEMAEICRRDYLSRKGNKK